jgi:hypothetical protein
MSQHKPSHEEDEYFAREEIVKRRQFAQDTNQKREAAERERLQKLHYMKCPKCGYDLERIDFRGLAVDKCFHCNGTWLDAGELEALAGHGGHMLDKLSSVFRHK